MNKACITPATAEHLPAIRELAALVWRAHYPGIISPEQIEYMLGRMYCLETMEDELRTGDVRFVRLLMDGGLIGFASYGSTLEAGVAKLHKLYLHTRWQRRGFGSLLLEHCERAAHIQGAERMILAVNKRNTSAIATYTRNGYDISESVRTDIGGGFFMDDFIMMKNLRERVVALSDSLTDCSTIAPSSSASPEKLPP